MSKGRVPNIWPFDAFSKTTVRHLSKKGRITRSTSTGRDVYKGYRLFRQYEGWTVPELDKETIFDTKGQAKRFIREWTKREGREGNPSMAEHTYVIGTKEFHSLKEAKKYAQEYANEDDRPITITHEIRKADRYTRTRQRVLGYSAADMRYGKDIVVYPKKQKNPKEHTIYIKNPADWFARCVEGVERSGSGYDPRAVCGAVLKRKKAKERRAKGRRNPRDFQVTGFVLTIKEANVEINNARLSTPSDERYNYRSYIRRISGGYEWGWVLR